MTLLLGSRGKSHILITADGQRSVGSGATATVVETNIQKVFPANYRPFAVAHHGQNIVNGHPVHELIPAFLREKRGEFEDCTVRHICAQLISHFDNSVTETLLRTPDSKQFAVWIAEIEPAFSRPSIYEICWQKEGFVDNGTDISMLMTRLGDIAFGGDGKKYILEFLEEPVSEELSYQHVYFRPLEYSKAIQDELYSLGMQRQMEEQEHIFSGHKHQLSITEEGCDWLIAPSP